MEEATRSADLDVTALTSPGRLQPLSGYPVLTRKADGRAVYTSGVHVSFTLSHNGVGKPAIIVRGLGIEIVEYRAGADPQYAYQVQGSAIIGAGVVKPHVFTVSLAGSDAMPARWVVNAKTVEYRVARSANFFDTDDPELITLAPEGDVEEIKGSILTQEPGFYEVRFVFDYSVAGKDYRRATESVLLYNDD